MKVLYISYDGVLEPLGESQVAAYLVRLARDSQPTLLTFEKGRDLRDRPRAGRMKTMLGEAGVRWIPLRYHKRPLILSTLWDVVVGILAGLSVAWSQRIEIVHARSYVPALIAFCLKRIAGGKVLFDMRGFWADEKVDGGQWTKDSRIYALTKRCEKVFFESADAIVSLTAAGVEAIPELGCWVPPQTPILVIPTCTDLERFFPGPKDPLLLARLGLDGHRVIGCVGTMHNWYLRQPMLAYLAYLMSQDDKLKALIVTRDDHAQLRADAVTAGVPLDRLVLTEAAFPAMPAYIRLMDVGLFFIRVCFSKRGSAATKLGEFLACGVPVIINDGVGDSGDIVRSHRVGVVLSDTSPGEFERAYHEAHKLLAEPDVATRCREVAVRYFDVDAGARRYLELYRTLTGSLARSVADHA